jgi:hypothetical protein
MSILTRFHPSDDGKTFTIQRHDPDVSPTLEWNKKLQNEPQKSESFHHIASVPPIVIEKWMQESGAPLLSMPAHEFSAFIRKKLRDPQWQFLKTTDKRI